MAPGHKLPSPKHLLLSVDCRQAEALRLQQPTVSLGNTPVLNHLGTNPSGAGQHPGCSAEHLVFLVCLHFWGISASSSSLGSSSVCERKGRPGRKAEPQVGHGGPEPRLPWKSHYQGTDVLTPWHCGMGVFLLLCVSLSASQESGVAAAQPWRLSRVP